MSGILRGENIKDGTITPDKLTGVDYITNDQLKDYTQQELQKYLSLAGGTITGPVNITKGDLTIEDNIEIQGDAYLNSLYISGQNRSDVVSRLQIEGNGDKFFADDGSYKEIQIPKFLTLTQDEYDAIATKDTNAFYYIYE